MFIRGGSAPTILDKIKWNSKPPSPPKSRMKPREGQKRAIFPSLIWGGGGSRFSIYFVQDCRSNPLPFYIKTTRTTLRKSTKKVPLSYTLYRQMVPFHIPCLEVCIPFNYALLNRNQSQNSLSIRPS